MSTLEDLLCAKQRATCQRDQGGSWRCQRLFTETDYVLGEVLGTDTSLHVSSAQKVSTALISQTEKLRLREMKG